MLRGLVRMLFPRPQGAPASNLRELVFGYNDGLVTTFTVVVGFTGAALSHSIIIIAALITAVADGLSMAFGAYLSTKSEREQYEAEIVIERERIRGDPEPEREALRAHLKGYGLDAATVKKSVASITKDEERWARIIVRDLRGLEPTPTHSPLRDSTTMFFAFLFGSLIPILPFLVKTANPFVISVVVSIASAFAVGAYKTVVTKRNWISSGVETMAIAILLMIVSYALGVVIGSIV